MCKIVLFYFCLLIDEKEHERIHQAINEFKQYTCIEIKDRIMKISISKSVAIILNAEARLAEKAVNKK